MKPPQFKYASPSTLEEALDLLAREEGSRPLAGGQSLIPILSLRLATPGMLVDLGNIRGLRGIDLVGTAVRIGAMTTHADVLRSATISDHQPLLLDAVALIGHPAIRTRGTVGGSLAHADPSAELPAVVLALGATLVAESPGDKHSIPASDFFVGPMTSALRSGELLTEVLIPSRRRGEGSAIVEVSRRHGDFATAGAVCVVNIDGESFSSASVVAFGIGSAPSKLDGAAAVLEGSSVSSETIREAAATARDEAEAHGDLHASERVRRNVIGRCVQEALTRAISSGRETRDG